ncbi:MAG TPA: 30S ribosomal protein S6 [Candidatus Saccharibacteria bacterium]|nr:30S ribosomal protein S6 [Candidatus Saccharibacteria bacterium]HRK94120.1 30S ribosomal protein S6 [Candidatus Saccharibacteria bacterium]
MEYELTVLVHPDRESALEKALDTVRELVKSSGGKVKSEDNWGKKKLAYKIKKQDFAFYVLMEVELPPAAPLKISNALNISDDVIRYLLVKVDEKERSRIAEAKKNAGDDSEEESRDRDGS